MLLGDVISMSVGEIIPIEILDPITVYVDGLPVIRGQYGVKNGHYSVKIDSIQHPEEFLKSPLEKARLGPSMMRSQESGELYESFESKTSAPIETDFKTAADVKTLSLDMLMKEDDNG
jgi:flagellar motor switch protein FliM